MCDAHSHREIYLYEYDSICWVGLRRKFLSFELVTLSVAAR